MKKWKWIHKWFSLTLGIFVILWAISGIILNHRNIVSGIDVNRDWLPEVYRYNNWNNAAIRGGLPLGGDSLLIYGNVGIWLTDTAFSAYNPFWDGFPAGTDNRKINKLFKAKSGQVYAATQSGLYQFDTKRSVWQNIPFDLHDLRFLDITQREDKLVFLTRSELIIAHDVANPEQFRRFELPRAVDDDGRVSLFRTLWVLHSGEIYGQIGILLVDLLAVILVFLTVSGYIWFFYPKWIRHRKRLAKPVVKQVSQLKFNQKWHKKLGIWVVAFLLFNTFTGMFLRPPLLIAIAESQVGKIPFSTLDNPNPWHDQLRMIHWNDAGKYWIVGTNEGLYQADADFRNLLRPFKTQPPLSVMGINVFEELTDGIFAIGSFNGLFLWQPDQEYVRDMITGEFPKATSNAGSPIGQHMISGMVRFKNKMMLFDYDRGLLKDSIAMPTKFAQQPMPLWNLALEVHTARIFQAFVGDFYILIIPLFGLAFLLILWAGLMVWLKKKKIIFK